MFSEDTDAANFTGLFVMKWVAIREREAQQANSYQGVFLKAASLEHTFSTAESQVRKVR